MGEARSITRARHSKNAARGCSGSAEYRDRRAGVKRRRPPSQPRIGTSRRNPTDSRACGFPQSRRLCGPSLPVQWSHRSSSFGYGYFFEFFRDRVRVLLSVIALSLRASLFVYRSIGPKWGFSGVTERDPEIPCFLLFLLLCTPRWKLIHDRHTCQNRNGIRNRSASGCQRHADGRSPGNSRSPDANACRNGRKHLPGRSARFA